MLKTGEWLAISVLGLSILFVFITISFFMFLIGPEGSGPRRTVEPSSSFLQVIFVSLAPAFALSFFSNALSEGSKLTYLLLITSGLIIIFGMVYVSTLIPQVDDIEIPVWLSNGPWIFSIFGIVMILIGIRSYIKKNKRLSDSFHL